MSLILEALRKSEAERQRAQGPGLHAPASLRGTTREKPGWGPWLAAAVGAALLIGTWWVNRPKPLEETPKPPVVGGAKAPKSPKPETPASPRSESPPIATPAPPPPPPLSPPRGERDRAQSAQGEGAREAAEAPARRDDPPRSIAPPPEPIPLPPPIESLPTLATLGATERAALPPLKVSMFVYSPEPARRFAIVDGQRIGEGALLGGGTVAEIRPDGVVIDFAGRRLLLPRP